MLRSFSNSNLFGEVYGEGPLRVVWLHGWCRRGDDFAQAARMLAERGVASIALDLPGFGSSPLPRVAGGARHYSELIVPTLHDLAQEPIVLVGHSLGGRVATVVASTHPELVRALVLSGAPLVRLGSPPHSPFVFRLIHWFHAKGLVSDRRMEMARQKYGSNDYRRAQGLLRDVLVRIVNESYEEELARLTVPVDFVWGEDDRDVALEVATKAASLLAGESTLHVLAGVGHLVPLEAPEDLVRAVERALEW